MYWDGVASIYPSTTKKIVDRASNEGNMVHVIKKGDWDGGGLLHGYKQRGATPSQYEGLCTGMQ